jgi:hypothetical protein
MIGSLSFGFGCSFARPAMIQRSRFDTVKVELGVRMEIKVEVLQRFDDLVETVQNLFRLPRSSAWLIANSGC